MRIQFSEPTAPRYIYVDPTTNRVSLMVPFVGGTDIGLDNTCQSTIALQTFFGKNHDSVTQKKTALDELKRYKKALEHDLQLLGFASIAVAEKQRLIEQKRERLLQIEIHIRAVSAVQSHVTFNALGGGYPEYPQPIQEIMRRKQNFYSMVLSPEHPDPVLRSVSPVFSVMRGYGGNGFGQILRTSYQTLGTIVPSQEDPKSTLIQAVLQRLQPHNMLATLEDLTAMRTALSEEASRLFGQPMSFETSRFDNVQVTKESLEGIMGGSGESTQEYVENWLTLCIHDNLWDTLLSSPFNDRQKIQNNPPGREHLSIRTQFFMGQLNIYCFANELSQQNFGATLDANPALSQAIASAVKTALQSGRPVEAALCEVVNRNYRQFSLTRPLLPEQMEAIKQRFRRDYPQIQDSPHFDEFPLRYGKPGPCVTHQASMCFDMSRIVAPLLPNLERDYYARALREADPREAAMAARSGGVMPHHNPQVGAAFELNENDPQQLAQLENHVFRLIADHENHAIAARLLLSDIPGGQKLFQKFSASAIARIRASSSWLALHAVVTAQLASDAATLRVFNRCFTERDVPLTLTNEMVRALYVNIVSKPGVPPTGYVTPPEVQALLLRAVPELSSHFSVNYSSIGGFTISGLSSDHRTLLTAQMATAMQESENKIYLTPEMAANLYKEATALYGENSPEITEMNRLNNRGSVPYKFINALQLLRINISPTDITYPQGGRGTNGYIVTVTPEALSLIETIQQHQSRFHLTPEMAAALYQKVGQLGEQPAGEIAGLSNQVAPDKIRRTLDLLRLPFEDLTFNESNGYWINMSPTVMERLRVIVASASGQAPSVMHAPVQAPMATAPAVPVGQITVRRVAAFRATSLPADAHQVQLNCPAEILQAFKDVLRGTSILGASFQNPYTGQMETLPHNVDQLTARHLQILARNETVNTHGRMETALYNGLLSEDKIAAIRFLVKLTNVAGIVEARGYGGYPAGRPLSPLSPPFNRVIVIDQAGLQWQDDFRNTGGLFFYPNDPQNGRLPLGYAAWQSEMYRLGHMGLAARPIQPSTNSMQVSWNGVQGRIDLDQVRDAIDVEFMQALDAAGHVTELGHHEQINFRFLKAGMGFFCSGIAPQGTPQQVQLERTRLEGIEQALRRIANLPAQERQALLGQIRRIELPFSERADFFAVLSQIQTHIARMGLVWGGAGAVDALAPCPAGFVNATTNCADPHAMIGNEGRYSSVDAAISSNANVDALNPGFNSQMQMRTSPLFARVPLPAQQVAVPVAGVTSVSSAPPPASAPSLGEGGGGRADSEYEDWENVSRHTVEEERVASRASAAAPTFMGRLSSIFRPTIPAPAPSLSGGGGGAVPTTEDILARCIQDHTRGFTRGRWETLGYVEVGIGNHSGNRAVASSHYHAEITGNGFVVLDKHNGFQTITDVSQKRAVLNGLLEQIPQSVRDEIRSTLSSEAARPGHRPSLRQ